MTERREYIREQSTEFFEYMRSFWIYTLASVIKLVIGFSVVILTLTQLNVREDPELSLTMLLVGVSMFSWGITYFLFRGGQELFLIEPQKRKIQKEAYKASLIFGIYSFLNVLFFLMWWRNYARGLTFLLVFWLSQRIIFNPSFLMKYDR